MPNHFILTTLIICCLLCLQPSGTATTEEANEPTVAEVTGGVRSAVNAALDYLASRLKPDGTFPRGRSGIAVSALAGTAFLSNGSVPGRGKYGSQVEKIKKYILSCVHPASGYITSRALGGNMYAHGFATLFLAEIFGMTPDPEVEEALKKALKTFEPNL